MVDIHNVSKNILIILGVLSIIFILVLFIDFMFLMFSYNIERVLHPERYNRSFLKENYNFNQNTKNTIKKGKKIARESKLVICTLCRNVGKIFPKSSKQLEDIGKLFKDYKIILYENDSEDNTRDLLKKWSDKNENVILLDCCQGCEIPHPSDCCDYKKFNCKLAYKTGYKMGVISDSRVHMMKNHRNRYLDHIKENYSDYDYLCVFDFDIEGAVLRSGIYHSLGLDNWDGIFANGRTPIPPFGSNSVMYDSFAFVDEKGSIKTAFEKFFLRGKIGKNIFDPPLKVKSAFNGMAFYKMNSIMNSKYKIIKKPLHCEHIGLHFDMAEKNKGKFYINPLMLIYVGMQGPTNKFKPIFTEWLPEHLKFSFKK